MKIYTKKGDLGKTSIIGEKDIHKHNIRIEAYGTVDELNSYLGLLTSCPHVNFKNQKKQLLLIQNILFQIGASLASKNNIITFNLNDTEKIESFIDEMDGVLDPLTSFILPGGDLWSGYAQISRAICRRAERRITALHAVENINTDLIKFMNRLSDYLFVLARYINKINNVGETKWQSQ
jgi:cob(I)alamin adenosyltransferase